MSKLRKPLNRAKSSASGSSSRKLSVAGSGASRTGSSNSFPPRQGAASREAGPGRPSADGSERPPRSSFGRGESSSARGPRSAGGGASPSARGDIGGRFGRDSGGRPNDSRSRPSSDSVGSRFGSDSRSRPNSDSGGGFGRDSGGRPNDSRAGRDSRSSRVGRDSGSRSGSNRPSSDSRRDRPSGDFSGSRPSSDSRSSRPSNDSGGSRAAGRSSGDSRGGRSASRSNSSRVSKDSRSRFINRAQAGRSGGGDAGEFRPGGGKMRRAFTPAQTPSDIAEFGDRDAASILTAALSAAHDESEAPHEFTHNVHSYPARMHPATARALIAHAPDGGLVLDPFCGSGTTLVEALAAGHSAIGVDIQPIAIAIAKTKTWMTAKSRRKELTDVAQTIAETVLEDAKAARRSAPPTQPWHSIEGGKTAAANRNKLLGQYLAPHVRRELEVLAAHIDDYGKEDQEIADILRIALSSVLHKVSFRASETDRTMVQRNIARGAATRHFLGKVDLLWDGLNRLSYLAKDAKATVLQADARNLGAAGVKPNSVDLALTSSPYIGTYNYVEQQELRYAFFGWNAKSVAKQEIGARGKEVADSRGALKQFMSDISKVLGELRTALKPQRFAIWMMGDSVLGNTACFAEETMANLPSGLELVAWSGNARPKLGARERNAFGEREKREYLFLLRKS